MTFLALLLALVVGYIIGLVQNGVKVTHYHMNQSPKTEQINEKPTESSANLGLVNEEMKEFAQKHQGRVIY